MLSHTVSVEGSSNGSTWNQHGRQPQTLTSQGNKFKIRVSPSPFPRLPLRCVEGINLSFWTAGGC